MEVQFNFIQGCAIGVELFDDGQYGQGIMFDIFLLRVILFFDQQVD